MKLVIDKDKIDELISLIDFEEYSSDFQDSSEIDQLKRLASLDNEANRYIIQKVFETFANTPGYKYIHLETCLCTGSVLKKLGNIADQMAYECFWIDPRQFRQQH